MSVTVNATGSEGHSASGTSFNYTGLTVAAGSNTAIVLGIVWDSVSPGTTTSVTWGSQAMTLIRADSGSPGVGGSELWGLAGEHGAVATGNQTLAITWTGTKQVFVAAMAFDHADTHGLARLQSDRDHSIEQAKLGLSAQDTQQQHALSIAESAQKAKADAANIAIETHKALNPPKPKPKERATGGRTPLPMPRPLDK